MEEEKDLFGTEIKDWFNKWLPLIVIMLLQGISLICLPMFDFSSENNEIIRWHNPEWYEWVFTIISEVLTVTTFIGFSIQGKLNVKDDIIELYDSATNRLIETISGNELGELVQKLNMASGIFINKKV